MATKRKTLAKRILIALVAVVAAAAIAGAWYVNDYYHADDAALAAVADEDGASDGVEVRQLSGGEIAFVPERPIAGLMFYPGAKVQPEAYAPLMQQCAEQGVLCVILKPLFNLAIIDMDAASGIAEQFPEVERWFVAGHSMGGVAAADYLSRHEDDFDGVVFLAAYPAADLTGFHGDALSVVGSNDEVLNRDSYEGARSKLPASATEKVIEGGNHAYFGNYGEQDGDGAASISRDDQQAEVADAVMELARTA